MGRNKENLNKWMKLRAIKYPEETKKTTTKAQWKIHGVKFTEDEFNLIYDRWLNSTNCELCNHDYSSSKKCMDHSHETGKFRCICCNQCNLNMPDRKKSSRNKSGHKNICFNKQRNNWKFSKLSFGNRTQFYFKTKNEALWFKITFLIYHKSFN
tara:strand:- start:35 stop:496 length:462 start_codon:yes stop_codon:yes gene_type:complete